jgi:hypothetical protein
MGETSIREVMAYLKAKGANISNVGHLAKPETNKETNQKGG